MRTAAFLVPEGSAQPPWMQTPPRRPPPLTDPSRQTPLDADIVPRCRSSYRVHGKVTINCTQNFAGGYGGVWACAPSPSNRRTPLIFMYILLLFMAPFIEFETYFMLEFFLLLAAFFFTKKQ